MTRLSVNINKIATIRNARGGNIPNVVNVALDCEKFGAAGITVHPRPDERHIRYTDVIALSQVLTTDFNVEGYPSHKFLELVLRVRPTQVTLVPDTEEVITSDRGWNTVKNADFLKDIIQKLKENSIRTSIFLEPDIQMIEAAINTGTDCIEFYTEHFVKQFRQDKQAAIVSYIQAAEAANKFGFRIHAGHGLDLTNLTFFCQNVPHIAEVSIGHALISDALYFGLEKTIRLYNEQLTI